jgi:hypothetical protein
MSDIYENYEQRLDDYREAFKAQDGQVGALFAINGVPQGVEIFDSGATFSHYLERLVSSYALGSLAEKHTGKEVVLPEVEKFMESVREATAEQFEALGEGEDLRLSGMSLAGGALIAEDRVVHLAAFNLDPDNRVVRRYPRRWFSEE